MGNQPQSGSRRGSGQKFQKSPHDKAKAKNQKHQSDGKQFHEEISVFSLSEIAEKAFSGLSNLGNQTFALSPFSQYFDDWLINVRGILSEFESDPVVTVDEEFVKERSQIFTDVESALAEKRLKEATLEEAATALSQANHLLVQLDADYANQTRTLNQKRNSEIELLNKKVYVLEEEIAFTEKTKTSFFNPLAKRTKTQKLTEINQKLTAEKSEIDIIGKTFGVEQEKLHDEYINKKQATIEKVQNLEKEIVNIETDSSAETRQTTCNALKNAITALVQRKPAPPQ